MAKEFFLPVPLYLQVDCYNNTNVKCGAACTQMVLHDIDPQRLFEKGEQDELFDDIEKGEQDELFDDIRKPPPGDNAWHNPPQGIRRVLNKQKPVARLPQRAQLKLDIKSLFDPDTAIPTTPYEFVIYGDSSPETSANPGIPRAIGVRDQISQIEFLSKQLIRAVAINGVAPIVAVREDNAHWIVVNGFQVEDDYRDDDLRQRNRIKAILIRNPLGRYTYTTVTCDSLSGQEMQVITGHECQLNPNVQDVVPFATWVREYMFSDWAETFVEVCDSSTQVADNILSQIHCLASRTRRISWRSAICNWIARVFRAICSIFPKKQITEKNASDRAIEWIGKFKPSELNRSVTSQNVGKPFKVKRLDRIDGDYYLVPVGVEKKISALINISVTGEFDGATILPTNVPRRSDKHTYRPDDRRTAQIKQVPDMVKFYEAIAIPNEHYIAPFDEHPKFGDLIRGTNSSLSGKKIRLTSAGPDLTITSVSRDTTTPYVWRCDPKSFSASRPFHNLKLTVQERQTPISLYLPVDDYCLDVSDDVFLQPPANYLEMLTECIKQRAGNMADEVLVDINRRGTTAMVMYKSNQIKKPIEAELDEMKKIICQCLIANPYPGLNFFRIKAFATNEFLTRRRGGGGEPLGSTPRPGGGEDGHSIGDCAN